MKTAEIFIKKGIVKDANSKNLAIFDKICPDFINQPARVASEYVLDIWRKYEALNINNANTNGAIFEYIIASLLIREQILPFYTQAKAAFVPNVIYDFLIYCQNMPIAISAKTSLRERYKQADLEGIALKYVHRKAKSYLLTLSTREANTLKEKIKDGQIIGIDKIIDINTDDINELVAYIKTFKPQVAGSVQIISGNCVM